MVLIQPLFGEAFAYLLVDKIEKSPGIVWGFLFNSRVADFRSGSRLRSSAMSALSLLHPNKQTLIAAAGRNLPGYLNGAARQAAPPQRAGRGKCLADCEANTLDGAGHERAVLPSRKHPCRVQTSLAFVVAASLALSSVLSTLP